MPKPYTVKFGPWAPDLQNVGVETPFQWSETELPISDCENVYYQDGSYRSMPSLSSIGPSLGTPIVNAFTWYDDTSGTEIVMAATANGFYQLIDGAWSAVPFTTNLSSLGLSISMKLGASAVTTTTASISPATQSASGSVNSNTFASTVATLTPGPVTSYTWSFSGISGAGSWSIASGGGTSTVVAKVTGAGNGVNSATLSCHIVAPAGSFTVSETLSYTYTPPPPPKIYQGTMVAGSRVDVRANISYYGYQGAGAPGFGSVSPADDINGHALDCLYFDTIANALTLKIASASSLGASYFSSLAISSVGTFARTAATYVYSGGYSTWVWTTTDTVVSGNSYSVTISP